MTTRMPHRLVLAVLAAPLLAGAALAQSAPPSSGQGLGAGLGAGGPGNRSGAVTATGQTKPPDAVLGPEDARQQKLDRESQTIDRQIKGGICRGCD